MVRATATPTITRTASSAAKPTYPTRSPGAASTSPRIKASNARFVSVSSGCGATANPDKLERVAAHPGVAVGLAISLADASVGHAGARADAGTGVVLGIEANPFDQAVAGALRVVRFDETRDTIAEQIGRA